MDRAGVAVVEGGGEQRSDDEARLHAAGLRVTMPRLAVLRLIDSSSDHLSADAVRARLGEKGIALQRSSVFNVLATLDAAGLVRRIELGGPSRFEPDREPHDHFRCDSCGAIENVAPCRVDPPPVHGRVRATIVVHRGLCAVCLDRGGRTGAPLSGH